MKFHHGDRVKVEYEAVVDGISAYPGRVRLVREIPGVSGLAISVPERYVTVIEPEYAHEGIYQDANGINWRHTKNNGNEPWQRLNGGAGCLRYYHYDHPARPLVRLVPEK